MQNLNQPIKHYKFTIILSMFYLIFFLSSAILAHKLVYIGKYMTSVSTFVLPFTFFLADVITEVYGYAFARKLIWSALASELLFSIIILIAVNIDSSALLRNGSAYHEVFGSFMRIFIGNAIAMISSVFINIYAVSKWKILLKGKYFWMRSLSASIIGEFIFTFTCVLIAFVGVIPLSKLPQLIFTSFLFKVFFNVTAIGPATILASYLKRTEKIDIYDLNVNFNPFKMNDDKKNMVLHSS